MTAEEQDLTHVPRHVSVADVVFNVVRGGLIGLAELIPGVSGGTIALIVGIYERVLDSGNHLISGVRRLITGPDRGRGFGEHLRRVDWWLIIPMLVGMATAVLSLAGIMAAFVTDHASLSRGLFLGMVAASVAVPLLLVDWRTVRGGRVPLHLVVFVLGAVAAFLLTSGGSGAVVQDPPLLLVFGAAAIAVCALALPGVSGSFFLLVIGLYAPTMQAIDERNLTYIAVFALGAITGLSLFIKGLHWLLLHFHSLTLTTMAGLMLGSLRALWPWQDESGAFLAPGGDAGVVALMALAGALVVGVLVVVDRVLTRRDAEFDASEQGAHESS
ncbi:DUF368 domain-containing protein [Tessaracoccus oleiagri]|uniref:Putative membrane protein n=1 Tax=Tessaracoccus oleiagri TaxID=686624 RepID=A0A1G9IFX4_9ACTN|nr:DUF368 domain-containing protein [Tessaracoccus oleiagri]SDL23744.1 putative membrane protein [Tessaracoccus oleiagri]